MVRGWIGGVQLEGSLVLKLGSWPVSVALGFHGAQNGMSFRFGFRLPSPEA
jgi:hypothetical protein